MSLEVINVEQGTSQWFAARLGIPTASEFDAVLARGKKGAPSQTRRTYMYKLAGELLTGEIIQGYSNAHMERGKAMEAEARDLYAFLTDTDPQQVGFLKLDGWVGCSPDSLIGEDGLLEIKTKLPHLQLEVLEAGVLPGEHKAQVQGQLWISGRRYADFMSYWPKLKPFIVRVERDEGYINKLEGEVALFSSQLHALVHKHQFAKAA